VLLRHNPVKNHIHFKNNLVISQTDEKKGTIEAYELFTGNLSETAYIPGTGRSHNDLA
jgi:hypothetical protein